MAHTHHSDGLAYESTAGQAATEGWRDMAVKLRKFLVNIKIGGKWRFIHPKMEP